MRRGRAVALVLVAVLAAVGLTACGSGGSNTSTPAGSTASTPTATSPAATATTPTATTPTTTASTATATPKPAEATPRSSTTSTSPAAGGGSGGGAAGFRAHSGDNSIPDYGAEAPSSERARATAALAAFLRARAAGDWGMACTYLAAATRTQLERFLGSVKAKAKTGGCARVLGELSKGSAAHTETLTLTNGVAALRIKGTSAFALFHGPKGSKYVMPMRSEGGVWKVSQLAPLPYPLGSAGATP
jgi:hypothetical protein